MCRQFGRGLFEVSNGNFTRKSLLCSYISLALSSTAYFGSLLLIVGLASYNFPIKWNFIVYMATSALLYLLNILSNSLIIGTKSSALSTEDRIPMRSSMLRNRVVETLGIQLPSLPGAEGLCEDDVQTEEATKTPPPPYEDVQDRLAVSTQLSPNRPQIQEPVSEDVKELLNKILFAINNRTFNREQLHTAQDRNCNCHSQGDYSGASRVSRQNLNAQTSLDSGIYPQLPEEVLEHFPDPNKFIRALAKYQSQNRKKEYEESKKKVLEENRKNQIKNQEPINKQGFQNLVVQDLENSVASRQANLLAIHNESLMPTSRIAQKHSTSKIHLQSLKYKTPMSFEQDNSAVSLVAPNNLGFPELRKSFNSENNSRLPTRVVETDISYQCSNFRDDSTFTKNKEFSQDQSSQRTVPQALSPSKFFQPDRSSPEFSQPDRISPEFSQPDRSSPNFSQPDRSSPNFSQPDRSSPNFSQPDHISPNFSQPDRTSPKFSQPGRSSPKFSQPGRSSPKFSQPDRSSLRISQPVCSPSRISQNGATFIKKKEVSQDQRLQSPRVSRISTINGMGSSVEVLDSLISTDRQQDLCPKISRFSQQDLSSKSPRDLQDIGSANRIGIPLKDYPLNKAKFFRQNSKSDESICWTNFERGQACCTPNMPLRRVRSTHALRQSTPAAIGQDSKTESASNAFPLVDMAVQKFSEGLVDYMDPKEWLAAWSKGLSKISDRNNSTLLGSRL